MKTQFFFETKIGTYDAFDTTNSSIALCITTSKTVTSPWKTVLTYPPNRRHEILETYKDEIDAIQGHLKHCKEWMAK